MQFLFLVIIGYGFGIIHKLIYKPDMVVYLYALNALMVSADVLIYYRNKRLESMEV